MNEKTDGENRETIETKQPGPTAPASETETDTQGQPLRGKQQRGAYVTRHADSMGDRLNAKLAERMREQGISEEIIASTLADTVDDIRDMAGTLGAAVANYDAADKDDATRAYGVASVAIVDASCAALMDSGSCNLKTRGQSTTRHAFGVSGCLSVTYGKVPTVGAPEAGARAVSLIAWHMTEGFVPDRWAFFSDKERDAFRALGTHGVAAKIPALVGLLESATKRKKGTAGVAYPKA